MTDSSSSDWSPADNPYAIAVSQAQLWRDVVVLTVHRMRDDDDDRVMWSSRQLDAHVLAVKTIEALTDAGIPHNATGQVLRVSPGNDLRVWLSFWPDTGVEEQNLRTLAEQIESALANAGLHLESINLAEHLETTERLVRRESLRVAEGTS